MKPEILYQDKALLVAVKTPGIPVQQDLSGDMGLTEQLTKAWGMVYPITRLDRPVGGLCLFAQDKACAAALSEDIRQGKIQKHYLAVVSGIPPEEGRFCDYLIKDGRRNTARVTTAKTKNAKEALLEYKRLCVFSNEPYALVEINLLTGRHHQIRVQFSSRGYPVAGDKKYGKPSRSRFAANPLMLWAYRLAFKHPVTGEEMSFIKEPEPIATWYGKDQ